MHDLIIIEQARNHLEQVLPVSYNHLDAGSLAIGQPKFNASLTAAAIKSRFSSMLPSNLAGRLLLTRIQFTRRLITPEADHWMGSDQPRDIPIITLYAELVDYRKQKIFLQHSIEFVVD